MILANELRVGKSIIEVSGKYVIPTCLKETHFTWLVVTTKDGEKIYNPFIPYTDDRVKPIPLTEDILLKCGFKKHSSLIIDSYEIDLPMMIGFKKLTVTIQQGNQYIYLKEFDNQSDLKPEDLVCLRNFDSHGIFMLHQLQNLYFALTAKELEVNL